jgi:hypothetical protein
MNKGVLHIDSGAVYIKIELPVPISTLAARECVVESGSLPELLLNCLIP